MVVVCRLLCILLISCALVTQSALPAGAAGPVVFGPDGGAHDLAWLRAHYGAGVQYIPAIGHRFELRVINIMTSGDTLIRIWVYNAAGQAAIGQPVTYSYPTLDNPSPDLQLIDPSAKTLCAARGVLNKNRVGGAGFVDFQIGSESWIKGGRGPYAAWVLSPSIPSDCIDGLGWLGGTNHEGPTELFFYEVDDLPPATPTPPPATATPRPGATPTPAPGGGDLAETNALLRELIGVLRAVGLHLGVGF